MVDRLTRVVVERRGGLLGLVTVAGSGALLIVRKDGPHGLELVKDLRHRDDEPVPRDHRSHARDGRSLLEDFGEEHDSGVSPFPLGAVDVHAHRPARGVDLDAVRLNDHGRNASLSSSSERKQGVIDAIIVAAEKP